MANIMCPPHHWFIESATENEFGEECWTCQRCGTVKFPHRLLAQAQSGERGLSNLSTVSREDMFVGGWQE